MCKHCKNLIEDKEIIHAFMQRTAERLSQWHGRYIDPDWISIEIKLELPSDSINDFPSSKVYKLLGDVTKEGVSF